MKFVKNTMVVLALLIIAFLTIYNATLAFMPAAITEQDIAKASKDTIFMRQGNKIISMSPLLKFPNENSFFRIMLVIESEPSNIGNDHLKRYVSVEFGYQNKKDRPEEKETKIKT